jgi:anti-anti-sigma factor
MSNFPLEREGPKVRVIIGDELTASVVQELRELLCAIADDGVKDLVLDFSKTTFLDTAGLSLLLAARNSFFQDKALKLACVQPPISSLLKTLGLEQRLNVQMG